MGPLTFEQFALRDNELVQLWPEYPADKPRVIAARTVPVDFPRGEVNPVCETGQPTERAALVFAERCAKGWQWVHMTPTTKSYLASLMMDSDFKYHPGVWVYFSIENNTLPAEQPREGGGQ